MDFLLYNVVLNSILVGIILMTQFITYPLFQFIGSDFKTYHRAYTKRMGYVVAPLMVLELLLVIKITTNHYSNIIIILIGVLTLIIWLSTFFIQVPCHQRLLTDPSVEVIHRLIASNWIRTILWTIKTLTIGIFLYWGFK